MAQFNKNDRVILLDPGLTPDDGLNMYPPTPDGFVSWTHEKKGLVGHTMIVRNVYEFDKALYVLDENKTTDDGSGILVLFDWVKLADATPSLTSCTCLLADLMGYGCRCGQIEREKSGVA